LENATNGGTLTINFTQPQGGYTFDFATLQGVADSFTVQGYRLGSPNPVFTDNYPVPNNGLYQNVASINGVVFNQLVISATSDLWAIDNFVTTNNTTAGVSLFETGGSTDVTEGGATDTYKIELDSPP